MFRREEASHGYHFGFGVARYSESDAFSHGIEGIDGQCVEDRPEDLGRFFRFEPLLKTGGVRNFVSKLLKSDV